jgi:predicted Zn-dependent protease
MLYEKIKKEIYNIRSVDVIKFFLIMGAAFLVGLLFSDGTKKNNVAKRTIFWESSALPLKIYYDDSVEPRRVVSIDAAIENWNSTIGREIFDVNVEYSKKSRINAITISTRSYALRSGPGVTQELGYAFLYFKNLKNQNGSNVTKIEKCTIDIWRELRTEYWMHVVTHELGHCLGIKHSKLKSSIMYPYILNNPGPIDEYTASYIRQLYDHRIRRVTSQ